jgi:threonyl-tRNA synthetase
MLVVGQKEADESAVSVRKLDGSQENGVKLADFKAKVLDKIATRAIKA